MPELGDDVFFSTIGDLSRRLQAREFSALELTRAFASRLERFGPRYNALALSLRVQAEQAAREVDDELKRGRVRGLLQGIPYGAKDLLSVAGQITTWGAKPYAGQVYDIDATAIAKLSRSGAVLAGKLSMVELAGAGFYRHASASLFGAGLNPWDRTRWSGGSSSGSGSAVAAGLVPFALGSETNGSILCPGAFCGVTGLRPTYGLVSRYGAMPVAWTMDKIGPMCRSAEDCGIVLSAIAGKDENDPASAGKSFYFNTRYPRQMKSIRIGYSPADFEDSAAPETRTVFQAALGAIRSLGAELVETKMADLPYEPVMATIVSAEGSSVFEDLVESGRVNDLADASQIAGLRAGLDISARDYLRAQRIRRTIQGEMRRVLTDSEVLLAPTFYEVAPKVSEPLDRRPANPPEARSGPPRRGLKSLISAGNLAGLPALTLPCGFVSGLPLAIQLVGRPFTENLLLSIGMQFQSATDFHRQHPKV